MINKFYKKSSVVEAMYINPETSADGEILDANSVSIAQISGWLLGNGYKDFKVYGNSPFGLYLGTGYGYDIAYPGDWVVLGFDDLLFEDVLYTMPDETFQQIYGEVNN